MDCLDDAFGLQGKGPIQAIRGSRKFPALSRFQDSSRVQEAWECRKQVPATWGGGFWHDKAAFDSGDRVKRADANPSTVLFFDVDNTLLDNDRVAEDLKRYLTNKVGEASAQRYWEIFERLRTELGYADYLGALQRYRVE